MQNAKDTFYEVLRERLAALNPERTVVVRGVTRPALVVAENELVNATGLADCFVLGWGKLACDVSAAMPVVNATCEISYATTGSAMNGGMDRGRLLAGMDAELLAALNSEPKNAPKMSYSGDAPVAMATRVWWGDAEFGEVKTTADRMQRIVTVQVMSYEEAEEM